MSQQQQQKKSRVYVHFVISSDPYSEPTWILENIWRELIILWNNPRIRWTIAHGQEEEKV